MMTEFPFLGELSFQTAWRNVMNNVEMKKVHFYKALQRTVYLSTCLPDF